MVIQILISILIISQLCEAEEFEDTVDKVFKENLEPVTQQSLIESENEESIFKNRKMIDTSARMVGGEELPDHPYMAAITEIKNGEWVSRCLGTIISEKWILTSGICVIGMELRNVVVDVGKHQLHKNNPYAFRHTVNGIIVHPDFSTSTGYNDIALLMLNEPIDYNSHVSAIHLGTIEDEDSLNIASIGWGPENNDTNEEVYHGFKLLTLKTSNCAKKIAEKFPNFFLENKKQICGYSKGKLLCQHDEGGPIIAYWAEKDDIKQVGIYSSVLFLNGDKCSIDDDHPLIFTSVAPFIDWINDVTHLDLTLD